MEPKNDPKHNNTRESETGGIPAPPRKSSSLKMSPSAVKPAFRFATVDARPPATAGHFMSPNSYSKPPVPDVGAGFDDEALGPSRSAGSLSSPDFSARFGEEDHGPERSATGALLPALNSLAPPLFSIPRDQRKVDRYSPKTTPFEQKRTIPWDEPPPDPAKIVSWNSPTLNKMPMHYPLERNNRHLNLDECTVQEVLARLSKGFQMMSIHAKYFNRPASAALLTTENVELFLVLWQSDDSKQVIVEVQRRRGDTIIFHQYAKHILDAASGNLDKSLFTNTEGSLLYLKSTESLLRSELARIAPEMDMDKEAVVALEIVYGLVTKDRRDARQLGMEGVCIMTNARKTVLSAAILASRVILLGDQTMEAGQGLHEMLLDILQKRSIPGQQDLVGGDYMYDSDDEQYFLDEDEEMKDYSPEYKEEMTLLFNLALDALSHALEVVTNFGVGGSEEETSFPIMSVIDHFLVQAENLTGTNLLSTFLQTLQRAHAKPHNAWLAAKCLRFICQASPSAAERTKMYGGPDFIETAFHVGVSSHAKLESECRLLVGVLTTC